MNDFEEFSMKKVEEFVENFNENKQEMEIFWNSQLCQKMISEFLEINKTLNEEFFLYFPEEVKNIYNWNYLSNRDIQNFIEVMSDTSIGLTENSEIKIDENCPFENYSMVKRGIEIFVMHGQGTSITIKPEI